MKTVIEMAREAGLLGPYDTEQDIVECGIEVWLSGERGMKTLERFAEIVRADEREACAKVCDELHPGLSTKRVAEIIRARSST